MCFQSKDPGWGGDSDKQCSISTEIGIPEEENKVPFGEGADCFVARAQQLEAP